LSIVRRIAEVHGATVTFAGADAGSGLVVSVRFRAARHAASPAAKAG
jgi:hypothetical protein